MSTHIQAIRQAKAERQFNAFFVWMLTLMGLACLFAVLLIVMSENDREARQSVADPDQQSVFGLTPAPEIERASETAGDFVP